MIKVAILGCDSSHTEAYTTLMNNPDGPFFGQAKVCWIWGEDKLQAEDKALILDIEHVLEDPDSELLKDADIIMVIARFGDSHYKPAMLAIASGKPVFIDKPFTNSEEEAAEIIKFASEKGVSLMSFSPLRFASELVEFRENCSIDSVQTVIATSPMITRTIQDDRVNSIYFYSIHAVDMLLSLVKKRPFAVSAHRHSKGVWANIVFEDEQISVLNLTIDQPETYQLTIFDFDGHIKNVNMDPDGNYYQNTLSFLFNNLPNGNSEEAPLTQSIDSVRILTAVEQSLIGQKSIFLNG